VIFCHARKCVMSASTACAARAERHRYWSTLNFPHPSIKQRLADGHSPANRRE
jgi:hypothetical protein